MYRDRGSSCSSACIQTGTTPGGCWRSPPQTVSVSFPTASLSQSGLRGLEHNVVFLYFDFLRKFVFNQECCRRGWARHPALYSGFHSKMLKVIRNTSHDRSFLLTVWQRWTWQISETTRSWSSRWVGLSQGGWSTSPTRSTSWSRWSRPSRRASGGGGLSRWGRLCCDTCENVGLWAAHSSVVSLQTGDPQLDHSSTRWTERPDTRHENIRDAQQVLRTSHCGLEHVEFNVLCFLQWWVSWM